MNKTTLLRWVHSGAIPQPKMVETPTADVLVWSYKDINAAERNKQQSYRKGRGRKKSA